MSDLERLVEAFDADTLIRPSNGNASLVHLSRAIASLTGANDNQEDGESEALADLIGSNEHLIFVLADGLGLNLLEHLQEGSFLRQHLARKLQSVFPSTTAVALTSLATGEWPATHGIVGWWTHLKEIRSAAAILQYVRRSDRKSLDSLDIEASQVFPVEPFMARATRDTLALFPEQICEGVPSKYFSGGKPRIGYKGFREAIDLIQERIEEASEKTFTYLYTPLVDSVVHIYGTGRPEVQGAVSEINREVERLSLALDGKARIVLTADHGFLDAPQRARHQIKVSDSLMESLRYPPTGDARTLYMHLQEGAEKKVREYFAQRYGERFMLISTDEAQEIGLLGPDQISHVTRERMGDMIAISTGLDVIEYRSAGGRGRIITETSQHSGLTPQEMLVPLVIA